MSALKKQPIQPLPNDVEALKKIIAKHDQLLRQKQHRIDALEEYIRLEKIKKFASSSEKSPDQHELFNEAELADVAEAILSEREQEATNVVADIAKPKNKPGRKPLPTEYPRIRIEHDLPEAE